MINVSNLDVVTRALQMLGVIGAGQPVPAEDYETVLKSLKGAVAWLNERRVVDLVSYVEANEIPAQYYDPLGMITAYKAAPSYGLGGDTLAAFKALSDGAESDMAQMKPYSWRKSPTTAEYY